MNVSLRCVVDASVGIKRFISDPLSDKARQLLTHLADPEAELFIPNFFYIEISNIFWKYVRANLYTPQEVQSDLSILRALPFRVVSMADLMIEAVEIACTQNISAYDASYVALSNQVNAPLLTLDQKLVNSLAASAYNVRSFTTFEIPPLP